MELPDYDLKVLRAIAGTAHGLSSPELERAFGSEVSVTLKDLTSQGFLKVHERDIRMWLPPDSDYKDPPIGNFLVTDVGKTEIKRNRIKRSMSQGEKWKERVIGFLVALLLWAIQEVVTRCI